MHETCSCIKRSPPPTHPHVWEHTHTDSQCFSGGMKAQMRYGGSPSSSTLRPRQNGRRFADDTFKHIFLNENVRISIKISLKFVPKGPINNNPALVQIMAWRRPGDKPLSEPMTVSLLTHICVTRPQWVNDQPSSKGMCSDLPHKLYNKISEEATFRRHNYCITYY